MASDSDSDYDSADSDRELQVAFSAGLIKPGLNVETKPKKQYINNVEGMKASLESFKNKLPWTERLDLCLEPVATARPLKDLQEVDSSMVVDVQDDFQRELSFYRLAQAAVLHGLPMLKKVGIPTKRPEDYFAEMAKTDGHMKKVRENLLAKQTSLERSEKAKKLRELRKFGKKVQIENIQKRQKEKKEMLEAVKRYRKGKETSLDFLENMPNKKGSMQQSGQHQPNKKRQAKNKKFGFGGQKKRSKSNTKESVSDMSSFSVRKHNSAGGKGKKGLKQRPGKNRRKKIANKRK